MFTVVTEQDVKPHGWVCETCGHSFKPGEYAVLLVIGVTYDLIPIEGDAVCVSCFNKNGG